MARTAERNQLESQAATELLKTGYCKYRISDERRRHQVLNEAIHSAHSTLVRNRELHTAFTNALLERGTLNYEQCLENGEPVFV